MVNTFYYRCLVIIFGNSMTQLNAAQLAALVGFGQQKQIAAAQVFERLTQSTARQHTTVAEHIQRIYQDDIQVALQLPVLIAIVHNDNLGIQLFNGITAGNGTVLPMITGIPGKVLAIR